MMVLFSSSSTSRNKSQLFKAATLINTAGLGSSF